MVFWGLTLFSTLLISQAEPKPLHEFSALEELELREDARRLFILGSYEEDGLLSAQRECLERSLALYQTKASIEQVKNTLHSCFSFSTLLSDLDFEFQRIASSQWLKEFYHRNLVRLPESKRNFYNLRRLLLLEIQYKEFLLAHPVFGEAQVLPGWSLNQWPTVEELLNNSPAIEVALSATDLPFEEFRNAQTALHPGVSDDLIISNYFRYWVFGRRLVWDWTSDEWIENIGTPPGLTPLQQESFFKQLTEWKLQSEFYNFLYEKSLHTSPIDWLGPSGFESDQRSGLRWLFHEYAQIWPRFKNEFPILELASNIANGTLDPQIALLELEIEKFIFESGAWSSGEIEDFKKARAEIETGVWLDRPKEDSSYRSLSDSFRNLMAIQFFPQLPLKAARRILDGDFFSLPQSEQIWALQRLLVSLSTFSNTAQNLAESKFRFEDWLKAYQLSDLQNQNERNQLIKGLILLARRQNELEDLQWTVDNSDRLILLDGNSLPKSEDVRSQMREAIRLAEENKMEGVHHSWMPDFLFHGLMIHLFPSPDYWENESKKFWNELKRQDRFWEKRKLLTALENDPSATAEQKKVILEELKNLFRTEEGFARFDESSNGVWRACFVSGLMHDPARAIPNIVAGAIISLVFKWAGTRVALIFILFDGGLRFQTAAAFNPDDREWYELDLSKGFSTPVGKFFAASAQDIYLTGSALLDPSEPLERLEGFYRLGELSYDFAGFSIGSGITHYALRGSSLSWRRGQARALRNFQNARNLRNEFDPSKRKSRSSNPHDKV